jgi:site-specific DNA-cytosine methylase
VADPRAGAGWGGKGKYSVTAWNAETGAVIAASTTGTGASAVADPRLSDKPGRHWNQMRVGEWDSPSGTVVGATRPGSGAACIADPRLGRVGLNNVFRVVEWDEAAQAVTGGGTPTSGGQAVADPRPRLGGRWGAGHYGILPWEEPAGAVTSAKHDQGRAAAADPRCGSASGLSGEVEEPEPLPGDREQGAYTIIALDGTWHRPLTTLELATLQGLLDPGDWSPFDGTSHSAWRERIGNSVPSPAAEAIGGVIGRALLAHWSGTYLQATMEAPWCLPIVAAWEAAR